MQWSNRLQDRAGKAWRRLSDGGRELGRTVPAVVWIGLALVLAGLFQQPASLNLWHGVVMFGVFLLAATSYRLASGAKRPAAGTAIADGLDNRVEELKDVVWELRESEARYRDLLDTQEHVIIRRDGEGRLTYVNKAFCRLFGVLPEAVLGRAWTPQVLAEEPPAAASGGLKRSYAQLIETAGGPCWLAFEEHSVPGQQAEVQIVASDITEARAAQAELASARDQAQAADRAKSRFLAAMSHEIRTPMNGIMGMASLLGETHLNAEQRTYLGAIDQSARTLLVLIDEILDFSKIEAGKLELLAQPFQLVACVQGAVELLAPAAHEKGLEIAWTTDQPRAVRLVGDAARVRQIMLNLIGNAVKYTDRGGVLVGVSCVPDDNGAAQISVSVKDTGIGMSQEAVGGLFAEFNQGDSEAALRRGGTGLGLAISRRLARAMGGDITVVSQPGRGATFTVGLVLPVARHEASDQTEPALPALPSRQISVLLAIDRLIERKALAINLTTLGLAAIEADDALEGDEIERAAAAGKPVGIIVCDAQSDPADAATLLARARAQAPGQDVRGVLLIDPETRPSLEQFRSAGFTTYLVRPVRPSTLEARFEATEAGAGIDERTVPGAGVATRAKPGGAAHHVLLAEDNAVNALLARRMLEKAGCSVVHVTDGEQAVAAATKSLEAGERRFDLILMDIHMPRLDGLSAATLIRALDAGAAGRQLPPMVALTANAFSEDRDRCLAAGLDDYLAKPFHRSDLTALLERWSPQRRTAGADKAA